jgi:hypothetical protein
MSLFSPSSDRLLSIYLTLNQYPILVNRIRLRMRHELFSRSIIHPQVFEREVFDKAIQSQEREGLKVPTLEETGEQWETRLQIMRSQLTDYYFSEHLPFELLTELINDVLNERGIRQQDSLLSINPELSPQEILFEHGMRIESMPPTERTMLEARLREIKVVLIRTIISDQLPYINIAREWFSIADLADIRRHKIGAGRIGGKAAGMMLAACILRKSTDPSLHSTLVTPESYFLGSDLFYTFIGSNNLTHWNDQKYKNEDEMRADYPQIQRDFEAGEFPPEIVERLQTLLVSIGNYPIIVRSSSLLEDNFGTAFAGKYESIFCPNQGSLQQNLDALVKAIARVYGTVMNPDALLYRRSKGLLDYDERMGVLIQVVQGLPFGHYYLPHAAGVAFSRNQYRWAPKIRVEDGFVRLVWGLGTRAVDRVGNDYPRLVALSHPTLRPSNDPKAIRRYSQQYVDLIDLEANEFRTLPAHDVLKPSYPPLRYLAQIEQDGYFSTLRTSLVNGDINHLFLTFDEFIRRTPFADRMRTLLKVLETEYNAPVDLEFTVQIVNPEAARPEIMISILQCRPQGHLFELDQITLPSDLPAQDIVFSSHFMVPQGHVAGVEYVLFVTPEGYFSLPTANDRAQLERAIGRLNTALAGMAFICVGPGRWGSGNTDLGVHIAYADIYNSKALIELAGQGIGPAPEPSLGTHFFQDLLESQIYPLAIFLDDAEAVFSRSFFYETPSCAGEWIALDDRLKESLRLIRVSDYRAGHHINMVMDSESNLAVAYLSTGGVQSQAGASRSIIKGALGQVKEGGTKPL